MLHYHNQHVLPGSATHQEHHQQNSKQMSSKIIHKYLIAACEPFGERQRPQPRSKLITECQQMLLIGLVAVTMLLTAAERTACWCGFALLWIPLVIKCKLRLMQKGWETSVVSR